MPDIKTTDQYAGRLLMVSFFLPQRWQVFAIMGVAVYFVYRSVVTKQAIPAKDLGLAALLGSFYFLYLLAIPISAPEDRGWLLTLCQCKVSLLLLPFIIAFAGPVFRKVIIGELLYFVYGCLISSLSGNVDFIYHHYGSMHGLSHVSYRVMMEQFTGIHPTYMGMFLGFSICILLVSPGFHYRHGSKIRYGLLYILSVLLLSLLVKSALIAMMVISVHLAYTRRRELWGYKWRLAAITSALAVACFLIPFTGQRAKEVLSYFGHEKPGNATDNSVYTRKLIFNTDAAMVKAHWLTGVGPARVLQLLKERYFFYSLAHSENVGSYDPHNEYFYEWLSFGIIGIVLFVMLLAFHIRRSVTTHNTLYLYCLIILCTTFFTETVLSRQEGVLFYALFTSLFFFTPGIIIAKDQVPG